MKNSARNIQIFKETAKKAQKSSSSYTTAFLFPFLILLAVKCVYLKGNGTQIVGTLSTHSIIINSLAGMCFFYYVRHTQTITELSSIWQLFLSTAYGLCSYGIIQENSISTLYLYAIFPVLFLSFEWIISGVKHMPFLLLGTLALALDPECAVPVFLLLIILMFLELKLEKKCSLGNSFHKLCCILLVFLMAAFRILPHLQWAYNLSSYEGFSTTCSPFVFLSRFLPGSTASIAYFTSNGMDIYFGLFFLLGVFLFFTTRKIPGKKRIYYGIFTLITISALWISPVRYVFNLFSEPGNFSLSYSFFLVFWCLKLAMEAVVYLKEIHRKDLHIAVAFTSLWIVLSWLFGSHNFHVYTFPVIAVIFAFYAFFLYGNRTGKGNHKMVKMIFIPFIFAELAFNAFYITNVDFIPNTRNLDTSFVWEQKETKAEVEADVASEVVNTQQTKQTPKGSTSTVAFASVIVSCIGLFIFLSLYFNSDKDKVYAVLLSVKNKLDNLGKS